MSESLPVRTHTPPSPPPDPAPSATPSPARRGSAGSRNEQRRSKPTGNVFSFLRTITCVPSPKAEGRMRTRSAFTARRAAFRSGSDPEPGDRSDFARAGARPASRSSPSAARRSFRSASRSRLVSSSWRRRASRSRSRARPATSRCESSSTSFAIIARSESLRTDARRVRDSRIA